MASTTRRRATKTATAPAKKRGAGRPPESARTLSEEEIKQAANLAGVGCSLDQIAKILSIDPRTFDRILDKNPHINDAISKGRELAAGSVMGKAYNMAISGEHPAMTIFWLKTRCRWKEPRDENEGISVHNIQVTQPAIAAGASSGPTYVVELNDSGKFRTARPREASKSSPLVIDATASDE
jgi:hypothetical protein